MVAVPADAAADMEQHFGRKGQYRGNFIRDRFRRMKMARVEADDLLPRNGVAEIKLVRACRVGFATDAEKLALHGIAVEYAGSTSLRENLIERF